MPTIRFHAVDTANLLTVSKEMHNRLATIYNIPLDHITLEVIESRFISEETMILSYPLIEVCAFNREITIEDEVASTISFYLEKAGYPESEVYFHHLSSRNYYANGEHF